MLPAVFAKHSTCSARSTHTHPHCTSSHTCTPALPLPHSCRHDLLHLKKVCCVSRIVCFLFLNIFGPISLAAERCVLLSSSYSLSPSSSSSLFFCCCCSKFIKTTQEYYMHLATHTHTLRHMPRSSSVPSSPLEQASKCGILLGKAVARFLFNLHLPV